MNSTVLDDDYRQTEHNKLRAEIANLNAQTTKLGAETVKLQAEIRWYPLVAVGVAVLTALATGGVAIYKMIHG